MRSGESCQVLPNKEESGQQALNLGKPPIGAPNLVHIMTYQATGEAGSAVGSRILQEIGCRYGVRRSEPDDAVKFTSGSCEAYVRSIQEDDSTVLIISALSGSADRATPFAQVQADCDADMNPVLQLLPERPSSTFVIRIAEAKSLKEASNMAETYAARRLSSAGIVDGCLVSTMPSLACDQAFTTLRWELVVSPLSHHLEEASSSVWRLAGELASLASYAGRLSHLRSRRELMLKQVDASEESTQLRIDEILMELRKPAEQLKPEDLEEVLREVTVLFSRLSVLGSTMRRDYVKASSILREIRALFQAWNEEGVEGYPRNSAIELDSFEGIVAPLMDFTDRVEALRGQLDTVLDAVRTYLSIQGQRMSIEEQRSSREQLIRMVNLQEILHKLEILIVAFYLTEMGRLFFEALIPETAGLLTIGFIPAAFIIAISVMRFLHRPHR
jgi:hypothetical protein